MSEASTAALEAGLDIAQTHISGCGIRIDTAPDTQHTDLCPTYDQQSLRILNHYAGRFAGCWLLELSMAPCASILDCTEAIAGLHL